MTTTSGAFTELVRLRELEDEAHERVADVGRAARASAAELAEASEALTQAERNGATAAERKQLEARLAAAQRRHAEPWPQRRQGADSAVRDAHHAVSQHAAEHLEELVGAIEEDGRAAAEQVDAMAEAFLRAVARRNEVHRELTALVALTRAMRPGDIARARSEVAAREVGRLLHRGGEQPPELQTARPIETASAS
jgi:hypothetical protein